MFCPNCKAILERVRTDYGIQEFCNCSGKKRSEFLSELSKEKLRRNEKTRVSSSSFVTERKARIRSGRSTESIKIPVKNSPSDYTKISLKTRLVSSNTKLPFNWDKGKVGGLLRNRLDDMYERFYRKFEDFFTKNITELQFVVFLEPSPQMTEFKVFRWGVGAFENESKEKWRLIRWYQGTKLPLDWSAKIREKEGDYLTPNPNFPVLVRKSDYENMNYLPQIDWFKKLVKFWEEFKEINSEKTYKRPELNELYNSWRTIL
ncbi:MAG: hypothetical protein ACW981_04275 [Candidatus Hodarchaeales archaeon]|jgi:hypothetical protein